MCKDRITLYLSCGHVSRKHVPCPVKPHPSNLYVSFGPVEEIFAVQWRLEYVCLTCRSERIEQTRFRSRQESNKRYQQTVSPEPAPTLVSRPSFNSYVMHRSASLQANDQHGAPTQGLPTEHMPPNWQAHHDWPNQAMEAQAYGQPEHWDQAGTNQGMTHPAQPADQSYYSNNQEWMAPERQDTVLDPSWTSMGPQGHAQPTSQSHGTNQNAQSAPQYYQPNQNAQLQQQYYGADQYGQQGQQGQQASQQYWTDQDTQSALQHYGTNRVAQPQLQHYNTNPIVVQPELQYQGTDQYVQHGQQASQHYWPGQDTQPAPQHYSTNQNAQPEPQYRRIDQNAQPEPQYHRIGQNAQPGLQYHGTDQHVQHGRQASQQHWADQDTQYASQHYNNQIMQPESQHQPESQYRMPDQHVQYAQQAPQHYGMNQHAQPAPQHYGVNQNAPPAPQYHMNDHWEFHRTEQYAGQAQQHHRISEEAQYYRSLQGNQQAPQQDIRPTRAQRHTPNPRYAQPRAHNKAKHVSPSAQAYKLKRRDRDMDGAAAGKRRN